MGKCRQSHESELSHYSVKCHWLISAKKDNTRHKLPIWLCNYLLIIVAWGKIYLCDTKTAWTQITPHLHRLFIHESKHSSLLENSYSGSLFSLVHSAFSVIGLARCFKLWASCTLSQGTLELVMWSSHWTWMFSSAPWRIYSVATIGIPFLTNAECSGWYSYDLSKNCKSRTDDRNHVLG